MDEDIIDDLADAFAERLLTATTNTDYNAIVADIVVVAVVIHTHEPTYDLRYFYRRAGFPEPYPIHPME